MRYFDGIVWGLAVLIVLVTFLNPGGLIVGLVVATLLLGARYGLPFLGDLIRTRQSGASAAKIQQDARKRLRGGDDQ